MLKPNTPQETNFGLSAPAIADYNNIGYRGDLGKQYVILISERVKAVEQTHTCKSNIRYLARQFI